MANTRNKRTPGERSTIALVMATRVEAQPFVDSLRLVPRGKMPCMLHGTDNIILAVSGIGKVNAAIATTYLCSAFHPFLILNLGAAGSTGPRCGLGGIFHVPEICEPDRPHFPSGTPYLHRPHTLPGFDEATLATQDRPIIDREDRERVSRHADMVDMEAAAVAQAAHRFSIPSLFFKFISDTPEQTDIPAAIEYMGNYGTVFCRFIIERVMPRLDEEDPE